MSADTLTALLDGAPRLAAALRDPTRTEYLGPCVVQSPAGWTRVGPTWIVARIGWVTIGPGAGSWGTTAGLAELAAQPTARPTWHAAAACAQPAPNIVFAVADAALAAQHMSQVRDLCAQAEAWMEEQPEARA
jgi:hypothetical protein